MIDKAFSGNRYFFTLWSDNECGGISLKVEATRGMNWFAQLVKKRGNQWKYPDQRKLEPESCMSERTAGENLTGSHFQGSSLPIPTQWERGRQDYMILHGGL